MVVFLFLNYDFFNYKKIYLNDLDKLFLIKYVFLFYIWLKQ